MKLGAADFLTKPVVLGKLRLVIEKILGAERAEKPCPIIATGKPEQRYRPPPRRVAPAAPTSSSATIARLSKPKPPSATTSRRR